MRTLCLCLAAAFLWFAAGCGSDQRAVTAPATVTVRLDGQEIGKITGGEASNRPDIRSLIGDRAPAFESWLRVEFGSATRSIGVDKPAEKLRGQDLTLYRSDEGVPTFAAFRRPREGMAPHVLRHIKQPTMIVVDIDEIRIRTKAVPKQDASERLPAFLVSVDGGDLVTIPGTSIGALKAVRFLRSGKRGATMDRSTKKGGRRFMSGYALADIIALATSEQIESARARGPNKAVREIPKTALAAGADKRFVVRANKRDQWVLQEIEGDPGRPLKGRLRGILRVEVTTSGK